MIVLSIIVLMLTASCSEDATDEGARDDATTSQPAAPGETATTPPATSTDPVLSVLAAADLADPASLEAVDAIRFTDEAAAAAATLLAGGAEGGALWAATFVYATTGDDAAVLEPLLEHPDPSVRAMAAAALLSWGQLEAAPVLADLASDDGNLSGSSPPLAIGEFAVGTLERFMAVPTAPVGVAAAQAQAAWTEWLAANDAVLRFDESTGGWMIP